MMADANAMLTAYRQQEQPHNAMLAASRSQPQTWGDLLASFGSHVAGLPRQMLESAWSGLTAPRDAYQGSIPANEMLTRAMDTAGLAATGGFSRAAMSPGRVGETELGTFGGRMAKTADHEALARAEAMTAQGVPRDKVWADTGWFQGVDGKWRFEIDDSGAKPTLPVKDWLERRNGQLMAPSVGAAYAKAMDLTGATERLPMGALLHHPELEAAYPLTAKVPTALIRNETGAAWGHLSPSGYGFNEALPPAQFRSTGLHEGQHFVQQIEDFATGANSGDFTYQNSPLFKERRSYESPADAYRRVAGEVEARTVQKRMDMTPDQRRARPPWLDYDVPESDQIVRMR